MNPVKIEEIKSLLEKLEEAQKVSVEIESFLKVAINLDNRDWGLSITMKDPESEKYPVPPCKIETYPYHHFGGFFSAIDEMLGKPYGITQENKGINTITTALDSKFMIRVLSTLLDIKKVEIMYLKEYLNQRGLNTES